MSRLTDWLYTDTRPDPVRIETPRRDLLGDALTAAARTVEMAKDRIVPHNENWQREAWGYYDELGEFRYAVDWRAEMVSRVRLRAAKIIPGQDEPELVDTGPASDLIAALEDGAVGGRAQLMRGFATQLGVPGECWLTGEIVKGKESWRVRSTDEIRDTRGSGRGSKWEVLDDNRSTGNQDRWVELADENLVTRVWKPHARLFTRADSPARAARPVLRELELVNRHIQAQYLSRLASAGILLMPQEVSFPVRPEFADTPDPFMAEWIATAREAIQTPGTAAAVVPIPIRAPAEYLKEFRFLDFTVKGDEKILDKRDSAIRRLATQLDLPAEVLLGMGDVNHWSAWQLEESGIKVHILPMVEQICTALNIGYLRPRLGAAEVDGSEWTVWYDASEIIMRPDRSDQAGGAYDRFELSGEALRREVGFDETDAPDDEELKLMMLKVLAKDPSSAPIVLKELFNLTLEPSTTVPEPPPVQVVNPQASPEASGTPNGPPDTQSAPPPPPDDQKPALAASLQALVTAQQEANDLQKDMRHWLVKDLSGARISHPESCLKLKVRCPFELSQIRSTTPGRSGTYELLLDGEKLTVGAMRQDSAYAHHRS